ncbi:MAG: penicillin-insensitive murein endopeptidase [Pseudomonadota bacterium]
MLRITIAAFLVLAALPAEATTAARQFSAKDTPTRATPAAIGTYGRGCLNGAIALAEQGPHHQTMRPSRNRNWGHPTTIAFLTELAAKAPGLGLNGILVGDISQPRGGPMLFGHSSHQIGLDADIWFKEMPRAPLDAAARETTPFISMVDARFERTTPRFTKPFAKLVEAAARDRRVARIFVSRAIKRDLCERAGADRTWLRKVRPWWGHHAHFHVRLSCPAAARACRGQPAPPPGDGCGADLARWFAPADAPNPPPGSVPRRKPRPPLTLAKLPRACRTVLDAK